jgi:hypothetical protein
LRRDLNTFGKWIFSESKHVKTIRNHYPQLNLKSRKMNLAPIRLNKIFFCQIKYWLVLLIIAISLDVTAKDTSPPQIQHFDWATQDNLVIQKTNGKKSYVVQKDQTIKIWAGKQTEKGKFFELRDDSISINTQGNILKFHVDDITKIKLFGNNVVRNIASGGVKIWGGAIIVAGFSPLLTWGAPGLLISVPAWAVGYGIYRIGHFISKNKTFNLKKKWEIQ